MKKIMTWVGVTVVVLGLAVILVAPTSTHATPNTTTTAAAAANPVPDHPEIRKALESLRSARVHIYEARHDYGGHKAEALEKIDQAIHQLEICMQYDR